MNWLRRTTIVAGSILLGPALPVSLFVAQAQLRMTVDQLTSFIKSSIQLRHDDRKVADYVKKIKLSNALDARTVEDLQGMGAGPQTVMALKALASESTALPAAPPPPPKPAYVGPPPPDSIEQARVLSAVTENALDYSRNLPNFLCLQVTRRYIDQSGMESYRLVDTIAEKLSYFDQKEEYSVISVNGIPMTGREREHLGGATSSGEFGSILREIFSPETNTRFNWERWATLRGRRMHVFSYRVPQATSKYSIRWGQGGEARTIVAGYRGYIYADRQTNKVMRLQLEAENMPVDFPIQSVTLDLNYDYTDISGQKYILPLKAELHSREGKFLVKNEVEFRRYNRFGADTSISFGDVPDAIDEEQIKEQPVK
ncbi:MAG: hypothetical protein ABL967_12725 [Bryobacteraceae bacterium]